MTLSFTRDQWYAVSDARGGGPGVSWLDSQGLIKTYAVFFTTEATSLEELYDAADLILHCLNEAEDDERYGDL